MTTWLPQCKDIMKYLKMFHQVTSQIYADLKEQVHHTDNVERDGALYPAVKNIYFF
jgi:hypothetical protein